MLQSLASRVVALGLVLVPLVAFTVGCAVQPDDKVAHGQDQGLVRKSDLLLRPLAEVAAEGTQAGKPVELAAAPEAAKALLAGLDAAQVAKVSFDVGETYLTINGAAKDQDLKPVLQFRIKGHYDLKPQMTADGVATQFLVKDDVVNARWQDREFIEVDALDPLKIKADEDETKHLYAVESLKDKDVVFKTESDLVWLTPADRAELVKLFALKSGAKLKTTLSRSHFTLLKVEADGTTTLLAQSDVSYFDLVRADTDKGELTPDLKKDSSEREWFERAYVEISPEGVHLAKPAADLMDFVYEKSALVGKTYTFGKTAIPLLDETPDLAAELAKVETTKVDLGDKVVLVVTEKTVDVIVDGVLALQYPVLGHFDVANAKDAEGERTATLTLDAKAKPWPARRYVKVMPEMVEAARRTQSLREIDHLLVKKGDLGSGCMAAKDLPSKALRVAALESVADENEVVCVVVTQTVVSINGANGELLVAFDVIDHFDIALDTSIDGEQSTNIVPNTSNPKWQDRGYVAIVASAPHKPETHVRGNPIKRSALTGQFIYTATVVAAHSENGLIPEGYNLQSTDRLEFEVGEDTLTAYKVNEKLNQSTARSPVVRYSLATFDIERLKNGYGDATHITAETYSRPWKDRAFVGLDPASNQIPSYFNDLLGIDKFYYGAVISGRSILVGNIEVEDDLISFVTEEVITPNALAGNFGAGETFLEPVAIKIKHTFMKVGQRDYVAKEYDRFDFQRFGYFRSTEYGLDPVRGKTDETIKHHIRRFDTSEDKQIHYYLSPGFPAQYKDEAQEVVAAWNVAFKAALGRDDVVVLHDEATVDHGDPRVNMLVYIDGYNVAAPLGYGPSFFDPVTGENLSAKAYLYGDGIRYVVNSAADYYDLATGVRTADDFMVSDSPVAQPVEGAAEPTVSRLGSLQHPLTKALPRKAAVAKAMMRGLPASSPLKAIDAVKRIGQNSVLAPEVTTGKSALALSAYADEMKAQMKSGMTASFADRSQGCVMQPEAHLASAIKFIEAHADKTKEEILAEVESRLVFTTLLHEVGHNLGLRHNFHGSFDEPNFPAEYHLINVLGQMGYPDPIAPGEWKYKYRGSSVMDYSDDFEALYKAAGPYDVAAIKYGYGDKLEKVVGVDEVGAFVTEDMDKATLVAKKAELKAANPGASDIAIDSLAQSELQVRPYRFCTDDHVENDPTCNRFDRGVTVTEITQSLIEDYDTIYQLRGFRQGRRMFMGGSSYVLSRYVLPVRQLVDEYLYNLIFNAFPNQDSADGSPVAGSPSDYLEAVNLGIGFFDKILNTIEPGVYHLDAEKGELVAGRSDEADAKNVVVTLRDGKYLEAKSETVGDEERVLNRGVEFDKIAVLFAMSMRGYPAEKYERASMSFNYFDVLKNFTLERFSSLMRDELTMDLVAVRSEGQADFVPLIGPTSVDPNDPNQLMAKIRPNTNSAVRQYASIFAMANYNTIADRTFGDYVTHRVKGVDDALPAGVEALEFTSANGLRTYVVPNTADKMSISFKIAEKAAPVAAKLSETKAAIANAPDLTPLKVQVIELFGQGWAIGEGEPMGENIVEILTNNFDGNLGAVRGMMAQWFETQEDPELKNQLGLLAATLEETLVAYEIQAQAINALTDSVGDLERDLVRYESDLLFLRDLNAIFGAL